MAHQLDSEYCADRRFEITATPEAALWCGVLQQAFFDFMRAGTHPRRESLAMWFNSWDYLVIARLAGIERPREFRDRLLMRLRVTHPLKRPRIAPWHSLHDMHTIPAFMTQRQRPATVLTAIYH